MVFFNNKQNINSTLLTLKEMINRTDFIKLILLFLFNASTIIQFIAFQIYLFVTDEVIILLKK